MSTPTVQSELKKFGLGPYSPSDPYALIYPIVLGRNTPAGVKRPDFMAQGEAFLRARTIAYMKKHPGDCGGSFIPQGSNALQAVKLSQAALGGASAIGTAVGATALSAVLGPLTLGFSLGAIPFTLIEAHHAQAVQTEETTLCQLTGGFNVTAQAIEKAVRENQISERDADAYIENLSDNIVQGLEQIKKVCNAACYYQGFIRAYQDFCINFLYPNIENGSIPQYDPADSNPYAPASSTSVQAITDIKANGPAATSASNLLAGSQTALAPYSKPGPSIAPSVTLAAPVKTSDAAYASGASISSGTLLLLAAAAVAIFLITR